MLDTFDLNRILRRALAGGGEFADIYFEEGANTSIVCEDGKIEKVLAGTDRGVGIRVISDLRTAYAYTNEITEAALLSLAGTVSRAVAGKVFDRDIDLRNKIVGAGFPIEITPDSVPLQDKVALVNRGNVAARKFSDKIRQVMVVYRDSRIKTQIANSLGEFTEANRTGTLYLAQVVAAAGDVIQTGYEPVGKFIGYELFRERGPEEIAETAARRAVMMLAARKAPGGLMPVVLSSEAGGTMVHEAIGHGLEADLAQSGMSVYTGKVGSQVASPLVTVIDDSTIPNARGSFSFDDEGSPAQRTVLVENGILKGYLYDRLSALKDGCASTGNGRREGYHARPIVRMTNTLIAPGESDPAEIVKGVGSGLFVRKMGGGQVNTVSGDFMFEVSEGFLIENGVIGEPVRGATLTGNGPDVLKKIARVGSDLGFGIGTCGKDGQGVPVSDAQPTLLIEEITVGGAA
ncbi:TldD/PmbA family protein [Geobacter pickeringii]|uniref:Peptidase C69 n=1 Tax=Geobacter pickeringii TaxID=345632 RepID=A0A0B5BBE7_9BACT|nr:TldD/PmbA family protein [Geobacter pickeringii]AJE03852.1 peptidase C69 [Geobacter pickeringii]